MAFSDDAISRLSPAAAFRFSRHSPPFFSISLIFRFFADADSHCFQLFTFFRRQPTLLLFAIFHSAYLPAAQHFHYYGFQLSPLPPPIRAADTLFLFIFRRRHAELIASISRHYFAAMLFHCFSLAISPRLLFFDIFIFHEKTIFAIVFHFSRCFFFSG